MIDYVAGLDMAAFVFDYDHNSPSVEHLAATHGEMFRRVRAAHPQLPILLLSRPKYFLNAEERQRLFQSSQSAINEEKIAIKQGMSRNSSTLDKLYGNMF